MSNNGATDDRKLRGPRLRVGSAVPGGAVKGPEPQIVDPTERAMSRSEARATAKLLGQEPTPDLVETHMRGQGAAPAVEDARPACLRPEPNVLVKLGSLMVHADEMLGENGHELDAAAIRGLLADPELVAWREQMNELAFLPVMRDGDA